MVDDFGSGIHLDQKLDFSVDSTGDLKTDSGVSELQKDLAFQMILNLGRYIGQPPSGNLKAKVAGTARRVATVDSRVRSVNEDKTRVLFSDDREEITVELTVRTDEGEQTLVFEV